MQANACLPCFRFPPPLVSCLWGSFLPPASLEEVKKHGGPKNSLEPGVTTHISKPDDDQGIKSYLKKTHPSDDAREAKPDVNEQAEELKGADKQSL